MTKRQALRDDQWEQIKDLLPGRASTVGVTAKDNRLFVEAVLYRYRSGIPWRDLPERFNQHALDQMARHGYDNAHFETDIEQGMNVVEEFYANENSETDQIQAENFVQGI